MSPPLVISDSTQTRDAAQFDFAGQLLINALTGQVALWNFRWISKGASKLGMSCNELNGCFNVLNCFVYVTDGAVLKLLSRTVIFFQGNVLASFLK